MPGDLWLCPPCGTSNAPTSLFCVECRSPRPGPTRWRQTSKSDTDPDTPPVRSHSMPVPESISAPRPRRNWRTAITVALALVVVGSAMVAAAMDRSPEARTDHPVIPAPPAAESALVAPEPSTADTPSRLASATPQRSGPSPSTPASALPVSVGMVDVQALALFDPSGFLNPNDPAQVKSFTEGVSTSTDSQVVLRSITDDAAAEGDLDVRLTLQSHQAAGFGPPGSPDETCTNWDITYQLRPAGGGYRILKPQAVAHTPC